MKGHTLQLALTALFLMALGVCGRASGSAKVFPESGLAYEAHAADLWRARDDYERVVVMFQAEWCGACKNLKPTFHSAAASLSGDDNVRFLLIDVTKELALGLQFDVQ
jgi:thiol:disulfide interchange protein